MVRGGFAGSGVEGKELSAAQIANPGLAAALAGGSKRWGLLARSLLHDRKDNCQSQQETPPRVALRFILCIEMLLLLTLVGFPPWYSERDAATHNCVLSGTAVL